MCTFLNKKRNNDSKNDKEIRDIKGLEEIENPGLAGDGITLSDDEYFAGAEWRAEQPPEHFGFED